VSGRFLAGIPHSCTAAPPVFQQASGLPPYFNGGPILFRASDYDFSDAEALVNRLAEDLMHVAGHAIGNLQDYHLGGPGEDNRTAYDDACPGVSDHLRIWPPELGSSHSTAGRVTKLAWGSKSALFRGNAPGDQRDQARTYPRSWHSFRSPYGWHAHIYDP
jgi:hypothetical protein